MLHALTRAVPASLPRCQLTHLDRLPIDVARARAQHDAYERALEALGCRVHRLPETPDLPDSVFVEDTAVVLPEVAVMTRPGAASRRAEVVTVAAALRSCRPIRAVVDPGTIDGGDVLVVGRDVYVGISSRTNEPGAAQLEAHLAPFGYRTRRVAVRGCLHLKSAVTPLGDGLVLANPAWVDPRNLDGVDVLAVDPGEPAAANALRAGEGVLVFASAPRTLAAIEARGLRAVPVDASELAKAEAGLTCCSLVFEAPASWVGPF